MTSFGWKRKRKLSGNAAAVFSSEKEEEGVPSDNAEDLGVDWLSAAKKKRAILLEDSRVKSKRLQEEGSLLAENKRYWEAIKYWDEAIELTPGSAPLHEMKAQAFSELGELYPAVEAAEKAVKLDPTWPVAWQTLARAQIGIGEIEMGLVNAQKSLHLDPTNTEVRDDLKWIQKLVEQKRALSLQLSAEEEKQRKSILEKRASIHSKKIIGVQEPTPQDEPCS